MLSAIANGKPIEQQVRKLVDYWLANFAVGRVFAHGEIEPIIGEQRRQGRRYYQIVGRARRIFADESNGYELKTVTTEGYRIMNGSEQLRHGMQTAKSALCRIGRAHESVARITDDRLSPLERQLRTHATGVYEYTKLVLKSKVAEISVLAGGTFKKMLSNGNATK